MTSRPGDFGPQLAALLSPRPRPHHGMTGQFARDARGGGGIPQGVALEWLCVGGGGYCMRRAVYSCNAGRFVHGFCCSPHELSLASASASGPFSGSATADPNPNSWPFVKVRRPVFVREQ
jgi:hypothetical protein